MAVRVVAGLVFVFVSVGSSDGLNPVSLSSPSVRARRQLVTCPGIPGYCTESYPGDTCSVVCAFGRNNVPECQADGTWTDIPRCIEHEPGLPEQITDFCPGIPGYCSLEYPGGKCEFECASGPHISSFCTPDGTWEPYPTCDGDVRETRDGCDPCPGPFGGPRNRTAERRGQGGRTAGGRGGGGGGRFVAPAAPAAPARRNQGGGVSFSNNNNFPRQPAAPARPRGVGGGSSSRSRPAVIQPARQTGFTSAPRPARLSNSGRNSGRNQFKQRQQQSQNSLDVQPGFKRVDGSNRRKQQQQQQQQGSRFNSGGGSSSSSSRFGSRSNGGGGSFSSPQPVTPAFPASSSSSFSRSRSAAPDGRCPGGALEVCIDVCPSFTARIFGACVAGCARRCPNKK